MGKYDQTSLKYGCRRLRKNGLNFAKKRQKKNNKKKAFQKNVYRPLANGAYFGGQYWFGGRTQVNKFEQVSSDGYHIMSHVWRGGGGGGVQEQAPL